MKKFLRFSIVGIVWTAIFLMVCLYFFVFVWNFNFLSPQDRSFLIAFWKHGGVIKSYSDYLFVFSFLICFFLWIWGYKKLLRVNYFTVLLKPLELFRQLEARRYKPSSRIVIKNIGTSTEPKKSDNDIIAEKLKSLEKDLDKNKKTDEIREQMKTKFSGPKS